MTGIRGLLAGVLALIALEAIVSSNAAADRTAGLFGNIASLVDRALDPNVAAIPDRRSGAIADVIYYPSGSDPVVIPPGGKYKPTKSAG